MADSPSRPKPLTSNANSMSLEEKEQYVKCRG